MSKATSNHRAKFPRERAEYNRSILRATVEQLRTHGNQHERIAALLWLLDRTRPGRKPEPEHQAEHERQTDRHGPVVLNWLKIFDDAIAKEDGLRRDHRRRQQMSTRATAIRWALVEAVTKQ